MRMRFMAMVCGLAVGVMSMAVGAQPALQESIPSDQLLSGEADEHLEEIGRRAAGMELVLQVNAPDIWESEILTPLRRGAGDTRIEVKFVNTLRDTVVIRGVEAGQDEDPLDTLKRITNNAKARSLMADDPQEQEAESRQPNSAQENGKSSLRPDIEGPDTDVPEMRVERPRAELPKSNARESSRRARADRAEKRPDPAPQPKSAEEPASSPPDAGPVEEGVSPTPAEDAAAAEEKKRFEDMYNNGRAIRRSLAVDELRKDDLIFAGEHQNVVVRRGISTTAFWLDGAFPENRVEHQERNRYVVIERKEES